MNPLGWCLVLSCIFNVGAEAECGDNMCPAGEHLVKVCTASKQTQCEKCEDGYFAEEPNQLDRCEQCRSCQQVYDVNCTSTTNAKCSCRKGFLCSNEDCLTCERNKCPVGEKMKFTVTAGPRQEGSERPYECEPKCQTHEYFDEKRDVCKPRTQCCVFGFNEDFPGNKTHDSICSSTGRDTDMLRGVLCIGFVLLSSVLLVFMMHAFIKYYMKYRASKLTKTNIFHGNNSTEVCTDIAVFTKASDAHLSQEECGLKLIIMDESRISNDSGTLDLEPETMSGEHI